MPGVCHKVRKVNINTGSKRLPEHHQELIENKAHQKKILDTREQQPWILWKKFILFCRFCWGFVLKGQVLVEVGNRNRVDVAWCWDLRHSYFWLKKTLVMLRVPNVLLGGYWLYAAGVTRMSMVFSAVGGQLFGC